MEQISRARKGILKKSKKSPGGQVGVLGTEMDQQCCRGPSRAYRLVLQVTVPFGKQKRNPRSAGDIFPSRSFFSVFAGLTSDAVF